VPPCLPFATLLFLVALPAGATNAAANADGPFVVDGGDLEIAAATVHPADDPCALPAVETGGIAAEASDGSLAEAAASAAQRAPTARPLAIEYSDGYRTRLKIHKYASFATLPLFVAQFAVGQKLYDGNGSDGLRSAHGALVGGTALLFGVNTVTGVWNLREGRKDPNHRTKRVLHGLLMLAADGGFVATGLLAPEGEHELRDGFERPGGGHSRSTHRALALGSMGVATVSYLMMLLH
jgi:hypothetical protein